MEDAVTSVPHGRIWNPTAYPNPFRGGALHIELNKAESVSANHDRIILYNLKG
ncbi:hypothetical protein MASR1M36_14520 [Candidatus Cloacimonadaceae bacterium]